MSDVAEPKVENLSVEDSAPKQSTVLESATDFSVVHPLSNEWTLWYLKPASGQATENWSELLKELVTVSTVEEFWGAYNSVPKVTQLPMRADFAFFKKGVRPEWEDPANEAGGKWIAQLRGTDDVDAKWLNVLLSLIGGTLDNEDSEVVTGVFAMVRPRATVKLQIWVNSDAEKSLEVAKRFKNVLNFADRQKIEYQALNSSSKAKSGLQVKIEL